MDGEFSNTSSESSEPNVEDLFGEDVSTANDVTKTNELMKILENKLRADNRKLTADNQRLRKTVDKYRARTAELERWSTEEEERWRARERRMGEKLARAKREGAISSNELRAKLAASQGEHQLAVANLRSDHGVAMSRVVSEHASAVARLRSEREMEVTRLTGERDSAREVLGRERELRASGERERAELRRLVLEWSAAYRDLESRNRVVEGRSAFLESRNRFLERWRDEDMTMRRAHMHPHGDPPPPPPLRAPPSPSMPDVGRLSPGPMTFTGTPVSSARKPFNDVPAPAAGNLFGTFAATPKMLFGTPTPADDKPKANLFGIADGKSSVSFGGTQLNAKCPFPTSIHDGKKTVFGKPPSDGKAPVFGSQLSDGKAPVFGNQPSDSKAPVFVAPVTDKPNQPVSNSK